MMIPLLHLGMLIVGVHYSVEGMLHTKARGEHPMAQLDGITGGTPFKRPKSGAPAANPIPLKSS
jgi:NAD(P)H dehydrogenase (quinone)